MPIHDLGYRHWAGEWTSHPYRWWVITRQGIQLLVRKKRFSILLALSMIPFVVRAVLIYVSTMVPENPRFLRIGPGFFEDFLSQQMWFFAFIIAIYAGAGLIANDLKVNALQIYLSKPITRRDYVIGKLGVLVFFLALPTLAPGLLLFLLAVLFKADAGFMQANYWVAGSITAYSLLIIFTYSLVMLALSSLSHSSRFAGINFAAVLFFSQILHAILRSILRTEGVGLVSLSNNVTQVGDLLFGTRGESLVLPMLSLMVLLLLITGCGWIVQRRVQAVEVVK
jgi:ABC-2 type transport system permease protein